jgi:hypothetical protein
MIHFDCAKCHETISVDDALGGGPAFCPWCDHAQTAPPADRRRPAPHIRLKTRVRRVVTAVIVLGVAALAYVVLRSMMN